MQPDRSAPSGKPLGYTAVLLGVGGLVVFMALSSNADPIRGLGPAMLFAIAGCVCWAGSTIVNAINHQGGNRR